MAKRRKARESSEDEFFDKFAASVKATTGIDLNRYFVLQILAHNGRASPAQIAEFKEMDARLNTRRIGTTNDPKL